jgi:hypothetical protein
MNIDLAQWKSWESKPKVKRKENKAIGVKLLCKLTEYEIKTQSNQIHF